MRRGRHAAIASCNTRTAAAAAAVVLARISTRPTAYVRLARPTLGIHARLS